MNPEVKAKWVAALRSGEYKQAKGRLRDGDAYCCLGVLCDLHAKETGEYWQETVDGFRYCHLEQVLPFPVRMWAGLCSDSPDVAVDRPLTLLNDGRAADGDAPAQPAHNFNQIADLIEKRL